MSRSGTTGPVRSGPLRRSDTARWTAAGADGAVGAACAARAVGADAGEAAEGGVAGVAGASPAICRSGIAGRRATVSGGAIRWGRTAAGREGGRTADAVSPAPRVARVAGPETAPEGPPEPPEADWAEELDAEADPEADEAADVDRDPLVRPEESGEVDRDAPADPDEPEAFPESGEPAVPDDGRDLDPEGPDEGLAAPDVPDDDRLAPEDAGPRAPADRWTGGEVGPG
ncbi:hypothetical protein [Streptomyces sp. NPDC057718]|uniref:hypothetical protein n=1 Tax=Streptomyces sp. NPDC057718 TaxID=3346225 RepID=UPI0036BEB4D9